MMFGKLFFCTFKSTIYKSIIHVFVVFTLVFTFNKYNGGKFITLAISCYCNMFFSCRLKLKIYIFYLEVVLKILAVKKIFFLSGLIITNFI